MSFCPRIFDRPRYARWCRSLALVICLLLFAQIDLIAIGICGPDRLFNRNGLLHLIKGGKINGTFRRAIKPALKSDNDGQRPDRNQFSICHDDRSRRKHSAADQVIYDSHSQALTVTRFYKPTWLQIGYSILGWRVGLTYLFSKSLKILEASTGIEPVYTDLQSAASPLRQLASCGGSDQIRTVPGPKVRPWRIHDAFCG